MSGSMYVHGELHPLEVSQEYNIDPVFPYFSVTYSHCDKQISPVLQGNCGSTLVSVILEAVDLRFEHCKVMKYRVMDIC